jgi:hypothetical protein
MGRILEGSQDSSLYMGIRVEAVNSVVYTTATVVYLTTILLLVVVMCMH